MTGTLSPPGFVPFGVVNEDSVGPRVIDGVVGPIRLSHPIVFNLKEHRNVYVRFGEFVFCAGCAF